MILHELFRVVWCFPASFHVISWKMDFLWDYVTRAHSEYRGKGSLICCTIFNMPEECGNSTFPFVHRESKSFWTKESAPWTELESQIKLGDYKTWKDELQYRISHVVWPGVVVLVVWLLSVVVGGTVSRFYTGQDHWLILLLDSINLLNYWLILLFQHRPQFNEW